MLRLMLSSIRSRLGNVAGALIAITIATSLIAGTCLLLFAAADASITSDRYAATSLIVQVDPSNPYPDEDDTSFVSVPRIDSSVADKLAAVPGIQSVIPGLSFYAQIVDEQNQPIAGPDDSESFGFPWSNAALTPFTLIDGVAPQNGEIVVDARLAELTSLAVGDHVTVLSARMPTGFTISGIVTAPNGNSLPNQASIFFSAEDAAAITGVSNTADFVGIIAAPSTDERALEETVATTLDNPSLRVLTRSNLGKADPTSDQQMFEDAAALLGTMAGFSGFVSIFVLAGTFAFSVLQRNREIGLLRSIGMTPRQVKVMIAGEGLVLALVASIIAIPLGYAIAGGIAVTLQHFDLAPEGFSATLNFWSFLIAIGGSIGISQVASFGAARRAAKIRPIDALRESSAPAKRLPFIRLVMGIGFVIGGIVVLSISTGLDADAQVAMSFAVATIFLIAASRLGPMLVLPFIASIGRVLRRLFGQPGELARLNSRHSSHRVSAVVSPLILATGFACMMFFLVATMQTSTIAQSTARTTADYVVVSSSPGIPSAMVGEIQALPGVETASGVAISPVTALKPHGSWSEYLEFTGAGVDPTTISQVLDLDARQGSIADLLPTSMALARMTAEQLNATIGDHFVIVFADGFRATLTVSAIFDNGLGFPDLVVSNELMLAHAIEPAVQEIYVDGSDPGVRAELERLSAALPTLVVLSSDEYVSTINQSAVDGAWAIYLIVGVSVLFAAISVINTMAMSTSERTREFSLLRLIGATNRQITLMVLSEAIIVLVIGVGIGIGISWLSMVPASNAMVGDLSAITIPPLETGVVVAIAAVIAVAAHLLPARFALRLDPIESIGVKQ
ncbi:FtsX-like permease family protein [soil metagenome]